MNNNEFELPLEFVENTGERLVLNFIDEEKGELYDVIWNKQKYDRSLGSSVPDKGKELEVAGWCEKFFGVPLEQIQDAVGQVHTVYVYDGFNSLWKSATKFSEDMNGEIYETVVTDVKADDKDLEIFYEIDDELYSTHMRYTQWKGNRMLVNPQKRRKQQQKFLDLFGVPVEEADKVIGKKIMVECKKAFNSYYGEIKKVIK